MRKKQQTSELNFLRHERVSSYERKELNLRRRSASTRGASPCIHSRHTTTAIGQSCTLQIPLDDLPVERRRFQWRRKCILFYYNHDLSKGVLEMMNQLDPSSLPCAGSGRAGVALPCAITALAHRPFLESKRRSAHMFRGLDGASCRIFPFLGLSWSGHCTSGGDASGSSAIP